MVVLQDKRPLDSDEAFEFASAENGGQRNFDLAEVFVFLKMDPLIIPNLFYDSLFVKQSDVNYLSVLL